MLLRKGVYPYEYIDRFDELELSPIDKFYSSLTDDSISEKDYEHAKMYGKHSNVKQVVIITSYISKVTLLYSLMSFKSSEKLE